MEKSFRQINTAQKSSLLAKLSFEMSSLWPQSLLRTPLEYSNSLREYRSFDVTGPIGKEFPTAQLSELLKDDAKVKDLAILGKNASALEALFTIHI